MNIYILFVPLIAVFFIFPMFYLPPLLYYLSVTASVLTITGTAIGKILIKRMFPVQLRIYEQRYGGLSITANPRAHRATKKLQDYYITPSGRKFKAPAPENIIKGVGQAYCDMFIKNGEPFPIAPATAEPDHLEVIPEDNKYWLATQIEENIVSTTPEKSKLEKLMPIMTVAVTGIILMVMIVSFMQYFPEFVQGTVGVMDAQIQALSETVDKFVASQASCQVQQQPPQLIPPP